MASIYDWLDRNYLTHRNVHAPITLVIDRVVVDEDAAEVLIYFAGVSRPYALRDGGADWDALRAITGHHDSAHWPGLTVRLYPVNYPTPDLELF